MFLYISPVMKIFRLNTIVILFLLVGSHVLAQEALKVKELKLSNGITVMLNEDHSQPQVFGAVVVKAGGKDSPNTGIAHYFEHIMFKGTDRIGTVDYVKEKVWLDSISIKYDELSQTKDEKRRLDIQKKINQLSKQAAQYAIPNEFNRLISLYGGSNLNAYTSFDETVFHNSFSPQYMEQWCLLNSERLLTPAFRLFQGELETVYEEKNRAADNFLRGVLQDALEHLFKGRPYAYPIIGSTENLKNPQLSEMEKFYKKYYVGSNMGLVLCGDFNSVDIKPLLERTFGRIPKGVEPTRIKSELPDIHPNETYKLKIPVPIISAEAWAWKGVTDQHPDKPAIDMAVKLLSNGSSGFLDSLMNEQKVMAVMSMPISMNDAGILGVLAVPNILASKKKAEAMVMQQIDRLKKGDFPDETLETMRMQLLKEKQMSLETMNDRYELMVSALSKGMTWDEMMAQVDRMGKVTKADIVKVANRYFNDRFMKFVKKMGTYAKDKLKQPGYEPIIPKNVDEESAFAKELKNIPVAKRELKLVDLQHDAEYRALAEHAKLYTVKNPLNDLFNVKVVFHRGSICDPRLEMAADYIQQLGTDSLTKQQFESAMFKLGSTLEVKCSNSQFVFNLTGWDKNFEPSMRLFQHYLHHMKPDKKAMKDIKSSKKIDYNSFEKDNSSVMSAVLAKLMYGDKSPFLNNYSVAQVKAMDENELISAVQETMKGEMSIIYSGKLNTNQVAQVACKTLPVNVPTEMPFDTYRPLVKYDQPTVFVYNLPKARQTLLGTYNLCSPSPQKEDRVKKHVWSLYFGSGMSSVMFQEVREFRSMAYSAGGRLVMANRAKHPDANGGFFTIVGTQSDKTMGALMLVDSLLNHLPLRQQSAEVAKQEYLNEIYQSYPSFRDMGSYIDDMKVQGYTENPLIGYDKIVEKLTLDDIKRVHEQEMNNNPRVYFLVGNVKQMDMKKLAQLGKIVMLKKADVYK